MIWPLIACPTGQLQARWVVFHQLDGVAIRVVDPGLAGIVHTHADEAHEHAKLLWWSGEALAVRSVNLRLTG